MIDIREEAVPITEQDALLKWLAKGEVNSLVKVAESMAKTELHKVLIESLDAADPTGFPRKIEAANVHLQAAGRFKVFIDVLTEFRAMKKFTCVRLS